MKKGSFAKYSLVAASTVLFAACSNMSSFTKGLDGMRSHGVGMSGSFFGQEAGEVFTTQAPHDQVYLFGYDNSMVQEKYMASIHAQAAYLKSHPGARISVDGHTDERGSREYNIALGERRANSVAVILKRDGVSSRQMKVVSYGKERPANLGHSEEARAQNRRVELTYEATK